MKQTTIEERLTKIEKHLGIHRRESQFYGVGLDDCNAFLRTWGPYPTYDMAEGKVPAHYNGMLTHIVEFKP